MSAEFTPGPWLAVDGRDFAVGQSVTHAGGLVCHVKTPLREGYAHEEREANARLIAAAPDGFQASSAFVRAAKEEYRIPDDADEGWIVDTLGHALGDAYLKATAFLAKARGEEQSA